MSKAKYFSFWKRDKVTEVCTTCLCQNCESTTTQNERTFSVFWLFLCYKYKRPEQKRVNPPRLLWKLVWDWLCAIF